MQNSRNNEISASLISKLNEMDEIMLHDKFNR